MFLKTQSLNSINKYLETRVDLIRETYCENEFSK
jgi:hypothetical protein